MNNNKKIKVCGIIGTIVGLIIGLNSGFLVTIIAGITFGWIGIGIPSLWVLISGDFRDLDGFSSLLFLPLVLFIEIVWAAPCESFHKWTGKKTPYHSGNNGITEIGTKCKNPPCPNIVEKSKYAFPPFCCAACKSDFEVNYG